ncbi:MAG TPA: NAD(P)-dependent oxidoreductase [Bauldia sp.]|nr:NAD(P)-dependent oxidoreductase [Bauldia sp.]
MTAPRIFVFGMGYTARAFARALGEGGIIAGVTRANFDTADIGDATHLLISVPPGDADPVLARYRAAILTAPALQWIGYLSSVGVYGNYGGAWVTERTTPHPKSPRAVARLRTEREWGGLALQRGVPLAVFRIAGIYGPGRNTFVNLSEGKAHRVVKPGQVFNRIHVHDIATVLAAAVAGNAAGIFNLADDEPAPPQDVVTHAAAMMGVVPPPQVQFADADLSPMARSFYEDNKRVLNRRIKDELGVELRYPTYREGLTALWREGTWRDETK